MIKNDAYVSFQSVQKSYDGETLVIKNLNLDTERGEFLTMLGPSGSGKTTCLMMLAGFETATHGEIILDGVPINNVPPHKRNIGMVFQNYALFPHMTVNENLAFPLQVRKLQKSEIEDRVKKALDMVQLGAFGSRRPMQLSGGQQQRLCIARAIAVRPQVLLMDEPCSALDPISTSAIEDLIHELKSEYTIVIVTHNMQQAARVSDDTGFFNLKATGEPGQLVEFNPTKKMFTNPDNEATEAYISGRFG